MNEKCNICNKKVRGTLYNYHGNYETVGCSYDNDYDYKDYQVDSKGNDISAGDGYFIFLICNTCSRGLNLSTDDDIVPKYIPKEQFKKYLKTYFEKRINDREKQHSKKNT